MARCYIRRAGSGKPFVDENSRLAVNPIGHGSMGPGVLGILGSMENHISIVCDVIFRWMFGRMVLYQKSLVAR